MTNDVQGEEASEATKTFILWGDFVPLPFHFLSCRAQNTGPQLRKSMWLCIHRYTMEAGGQPGVSAVPHNAIHLVF